MSDRKEINGSGAIEWYYPQIYDGEPKDRLTVSLYHTRAADDLIIEFDSKRNGYVLYMSETVWSADGTCIEERPPIEVGFIPAWREASK